MTNNIALTGGVLTTSQRELTPEDLAPNNYLTIVWKDVNVGDLIKHLDIDNEKAIEYSNRLSASIDNAISNNKVQYAGQNKFINLESIAKYVAQNSIDAGAQRTVINALIGVASGGAKKLPNNVTNLCLNMFGNIADKTARKLGFTDPHNIFSQVAGQNVINVLGELGKQTKSFLDDKIKEINGSKKTNTVSSEGDEKNKKQYAGLLLGLTTSDTESYEVTIPRKKVEDGSDYTTHLLPQPFKKEFSVKLTNKILSSDFNQLTEINAIEYTKDKLIEIAQSKTLFDIYIRLSADKIYKRSNVVFSSLSFTKDEGSGNSYTATFTIEPIGSFKTKTFISNKKYKSSGTGNSSSGSGNSRTQGNKTTNGNSVNVGYFDKKYDQLKNATMKSKNDVINYAKNHNPKFALMHVEGGNPEYLFVDRDSVTMYKNTYILKRDVSKVPFHGSQGDYHEEVMMLRPGVSVFGGIVTVDTRRGKGRYTINVY